MPQRLIASLFLALSVIIPPLALAKESAPIIKVEELGKGLIHLEQPWLFHVGDDVRWAEPNIDDAPGQGGWENIVPTSPWGAQGHYAYTGFAWYRLRLSIRSSAGQNPEIRLVLPSVADACEIYWNGSLIGHYGTLPPHPSWPAVDAPAVFTLPQSSNGTLAVRVWKSGLGSSSSGEVGGLTEAPMLGDPESVDAYVGSWNYGFLKGTLYNDALNVLYLIVGMTGLVLWVRRRSESVLLWFSVFAICPAIWNSLFFMRIPISSQLASFIVQPLWQLRNVALWFLLIDMLNLRNRPRVARWAKILGVVSVTAAILDGGLVYAPAAWIAPDTGAWIDGILTVISCKAPASCSRF